MLVLASSSPRRKQLLGLTGWEYMAIPADIDEQVRMGESPEAYVYRLASSKAAAVAERLERSAISNGLILAADTTVAAEGLSENPASGTLVAPAQPDMEILGKPMDANQARQMLRSLRGRTHQVLTGVVVLRVRDCHMVGDVCLTEVLMRNYSDKEMQEYIASGDPLDKAGAYAIQHNGFNPVQSIHGCYANVMGLPVCHVSRLLAGFGYTPQSDIAQACQMELGYPCQVYRQTLGED